MQMPSDFPFSNPMDSWGVWIFAACVGIVYAVRSYFGGPECRSGKRLTGKVAIVTGVGSGSIGEQVAIDLAQRNAKVILSGRPGENNHEIAATIRKRSGNENVHYIPMDLLSFKSIEAFLAEFASSHDALHLLINCAGTMLSPFQLSAEGFESQFQVNFLAQYFLTRSLLPILRQTAASCPEKETRVVNVTCRAYALAEVLDLTRVRGSVDGGAVGDRGETHLINKDNYDPGAAYSLSKAATTMASLELSRRLKDDGVTVNLVHPGVVNSNHGRNMAIFANILFKLTFYPAFWLFTKSPWHGAQTVVFCAVADACKGVTGKYYADLFEKEIEGIANDEAAAKVLLEQADAWIADTNKSE